MGAGANVEGRPVRVNERYKVTAKCENGHEQSIIYEGMSEEQIKMFAGLLDGSSPFYVIKPEPGKSQIGTCQICGKGFAATVEKCD